MNGKWFIDAQGFVNFIKSGAVVYRIHIDDIIIEWLMEHFPQASYWDIDAKGFVRIFRKDKLSRRIHVDKIIATWIEDKLRESNKKQIRPTLIGLLGEWIRGK